MFFEKYNDKKDGVIRGFDMHSPAVRFACVLIMLFCLIIVICAIFPIVWVFLASFKDIKEFNTNVSILPKSYDFSLLSQTWKQLNFLNSYKNSLIVVCGSVVCAVFFNGLLAYALAILKPKGHNIVMMLLMFSMLIPSSTNTIALFKNINSLGLSGSFLPLCLSSGASAFNVIMFKQFFEGIPGELLDAARLDGCGALKVFSVIVLPLSKPIIAVIAIFAITGSWSDFLLPYLVLNGSGKETVMVTLFRFKDLATMTAVNILRACMFAIIPPTILFVFFQKQITDGAMAGAVKG